MVGARIALITTITRTLNPNSFVKALSPFLVSVSSRLNRYVEKLETDEAHEMRLPNWTGKTTKSPTNIRTKHSYSLGPSVKC
jgi:hypothetical protein